MSIVDFNVGLFNPLFIHERYKLLIETKKNQGEVDPEILRQWRKRTKLLSDDHFSKMLESMEFDLDYFILSIGLPDDTTKYLYKKKILQSHWYQVFEESIELIRNRDISYQTEMGFSYIVRPFLRYFFDRFEEYRLSDPQLIVFDKKVGVQLQQHLATELVRIAQKTFVLELNISKLRNELIGNDPTERFHSFIKQFEDLNKILSFYREYITLARSLATVTIYYLENQKRLMERITKYKESIYELFNIEKYERIEQISLGEGDTHEHGQAVAKLTFTSGKSIFYKPKNLQISLAYQRFVHWINEKQEVLDMPTYQVACFDDFTLEESIAYQPCRSEKEVERFYTRFGQLSAIMYLLQGTDMHMENIVANGEYPYIVDLETLFQADVPLNLPKSGELEAYNTMSRFVTSTGLLPDKMFKLDYREEGIDISALNGKSQTLPHKVLGPVNIATDNMRYDYVETKIDNAKNIPIINQKIVDYSNYANHIIDGFQQMCQLFLKYKQEILNENGILSNFKGVRVRIILRNTAQYAKILDYSYHPDYMRDALIREQMLQNIWSFPFKKKEVIKSEYIDLLHHDIPIFYSYTDSHDLIDSRGHKYRNFFEDTGYQVVMNKINNLTQAEVNRQISVMKVSLGLYPSMVSKPVYHETLASIVSVQKTRSIEEREIFIREAERISDLLLDEAFIDQDSNLISWLTVNPKNKDQWNIGPVDGTFYDGLSGMTLFFYYLYRLTNKAKYERIYRIVLNSAEHKIKELPNVSGFTGRASLLYPLRKILANEKEDRLARVLNEIIEDCDRQYKTLDQYDWVGGTASLVYQFLDHYLTTRNLDALTLSIKLGNLLIKQLDENDEPMSGFAHGASSLALVLIKLGEITKNRKFKERGLMLLEYDRSKINAGKEDSTINNGIFKESWCHGTTGVGLSRIKISKIYTDPWLDDEIDRSINDLFKSKFHGDDCLCHGNMGSTELFLSKYEVSGEKRYLYTARKIAIDIINKAEKRGHYQVRSIPGFTAIGLFTGLSGIGYQLLRLADHKTVPSVLTLD